jgi:hypothetical protein
MSSPAQQPIPPTTWLMPREAYTSAEWFEREQRDLFSRCWAFTGMTDDIPGEGDYTTVNVGGHPIVVVRGPNDEMRAFTTCAGTAVSNSSRAEAMCGAVSAASPIVGGTAWTDR